jgi:hypothetical protein
MLVQNAIPLQGDRAVLSKCWVTEEEGVTFPKFRQDENLNQRIELQKALFSVLEERSFSKSRSSFFRSISANLWDTGSLYAVSPPPERKVFSYNKRTIDRAMGPF